VTEANLLRDDNCLMTARQEAHHALVGQGQVRLCDAVVNSCCDGCLNLRPDARYGLHNPTRQYSTALLFVAELVTNQGFHCCHDQLATAAEAVGGLTARMLLLQQCRCGSAY
jgi:hypothetical protein